MASGATGTYGLPYPLQTDPVDVAADAQLLATAVEVELLLRAPLDSPTFTGIPLAPTPSTSDNSTKIATTAYVKGQSYLTTTTAASTYAPLASPTFTGVPAAPTATNGTNTTQVATTAFVQNALSTFVTLPSQTGNSGKYLTTNGTTASWNNIAQSDVTGLAATISGLSTTYAPLNVPPVSKGANYTLGLDSGTAESGKLFEMSVGTANTFFIPTDATTNFPIGTTVMVVQSGTGQTTIAAVTPGTTTVVATPGAKLRTQWSVATVIKRAANYWIVTGDITA